jgi:hypothetical protein
MSDIHNAKAPPTFTQIVQQFQHEKHDDKHIRSSGSELYVHHALLSGFSEKAARERLEKQQEGAREVKGAIARDYGPMVAEYLFRSDPKVPGQKEIITVSDLRTMKVKLEKDPKALELRREHATQQHIQNQRAIYDFVKKQIPDPSQIGSFLRGNDPGNSTIIGHLGAACGDRLTKICGMIAEYVGHGGAAAMTMAEVDKLAPKDREAAVAQSMKNLNKAMTMLFGGTDPADIKKAAGILPKEYCDLLAAALLAVKNDEKSGIVQKQEMQKIIFANFCALRLVNPTLLSSSQNLGSSGQTAVKELMKQIQNICNGANFEKEPIANTNEFNALVHQWAPRYQIFMEEVVARGQPTVT